MPALSFQEVWLDALLSERKKQTTRANDRIKVGDICHIYNQQRLEINSKPLRKLTPEGDEMMREREYPRVRKLPEGTYYAHFLGKVEIAETYSVRPSKMRGVELEVWTAMWSYADGFNTFLDANEWFTMNYGDDWMDRTWHVIRWDGWLERYFLSDGER